MGAAPKSKNNEKTTSKKSKKSAASGPGFSGAERDAMKDRAAELQADATRARGSDKVAADEQAVLAKIAEMPASDRAMAERLFALVARAAPELAPKLWYGQPAFAKKGTVVCFFRSGQMDKARYSTFGFAEAADLDDASGLWPSSFALAELTDAAVERLTKLIKQAVS